MKIAFVYNDYNDVRGISTVMEVSERYVYSIGSEISWVNTKGNPVINMSDGSSVYVLPVSKGISDLKEYDKVYIDKTIESFMETTHFGNKIESYNKDSFKN